MSSYTAFALQISSLCSIYFLLLWSKSRMKRNMVQFPATPEQALTMQEHCAAPSSWKLKLLLLFTPHHWSPHSIGVRMQEPQISTSALLAVQTFPDMLHPKTLASLLGQPLSRVFLPQPGSFALSCLVSEYSYKMLFACLDSRWDSPNACPVGSPLGFSFRALSLNRRPEGLFWVFAMLPCWLCLQLLLAAYPLSCCVSIKWTSHTLLPSYVFQKRLRTLHFRKISSLIPCNASALVGWDKMSFCIFGYQ